MTRILLLLLLLLGGRRDDTAIVTASNPFSSNVVALDAQNWRQEVLDSPHAVFVNVCRSG